jgi:hypothetical protein
MTDLSAAISFFIVCAVAFTLTKGVYLIESHEIYEEFYLPSSTSFPPSLYPHLLILLSTHPSAQYTRICAGVRAAVAPAIWTLAVASASLSFCWVALSVGLANASFTSV